MGGRRRGSGPAAGNAAGPSGPPSGPRRPAAPAANSPKRPSARGAERPAPSLVYKTKESTRSLPDLRLRTDDVGRAFLYQPVVSDNFQVPDSVSGRRSTERLTRRAVRQIKGAAIKAHNLGLGLCTFITFTVAAEHREAFASGDLVLGKEMKRVLNAFSEWLRRRGRERLVYIWVAENKDDSNPHVHLLTNYRVPRKEFDALCVHVESLWGFGFARIEKVRHPEQAGRYIMKALGYAVKGADDDQGTVIGNRYGIARAILPKYETVDLCDCGAAAAGLRAVQAEMTEDIEELAEGVWLTRHGVAFAAGTKPARVRTVIEELARLYLVEAK